MNRMAKEKCFNDLKNNKHILTTSLYLKDLKIIYDEKAAIDYIMLFFEDDNQTPLTLISNDEITIKPEETIKIDTYWIVQIFENYRDEQLFNFNITIQDINQESTILQFTNASLYKYNTELTYNNADIKRMYIPYKFEPKPIKTHAQQQKERKKKQLNKLLGI